MRLNMLGMLVAAALAAVGSANAAEPLQATPAKSDFSCLVQSSLVSRSLFNNTGSFATTGPAINSFVDCTYNPIGLYVNLWGSAPLRDFDIGSEVDTRVGWRGTVGNYFDIDASVAEYNFGIGNGVRFNTADARLTASHTFDIGYNMSLKPYATFDYQHSITLHANDIGVAGGMVFNWKLMARVSLSVDTAVWYHPVAEFFPGKGPVYSVSPQLSFAVTDKLTAGPMAMFTWGDVTAPDDHRAKAMFGMFASYKF